MTFVLFLRQSEWVDAGRSPNSNSSYLSTRKRSIRGHKLHVGLVAKNADSAHALPECSHKQTAVENLARWPPPQLGR